MKKLLSLLTVFIILISCVFTVSAGNVDYIGEMAVSTDGEISVGYRTENRIVYMNNETNSQEMDVSYMKDALADTDFGGTTDERIRILYNYVTSSYTKEHYEQYLFERTGVEFECEISFSPVASGINENGVEYSMMEITVLSKKDEYNRYKDVLVEVMSIVGDDIYLFEATPVSARKPAFMDVIESLRIAQKSEMPIQISVNGEMVFPDSDPVIIEDRTLVPIRVVVEKLGYTVGWDGENSIVTISDSEENSLFVDIKNSKLYNEEKEFAMDVAPRIINDRTYLPLRAVGEALECEVSWDAENRTVIIEKK